jgi:hypothetical protein
MAGQVTGGQTLTPNPNVNAPAGIGGSLWGANGGGITPVGVGKTIMGTLSDGETAANYQASPPASINASEANTALSGQTLDSAIPSGNSNSG